MQSSIIYKLKKRQIMDKLATVENQFDDKMLASIGKAKVVAEITSDYLKMEDGQVSRFIVLGKTIFKDENQDERKAVRLFDIDEKRPFMSAATVLVNSCSMALDNTESDRVVAVQVTCKGKAQGKNYIDYKVELLG